MIDNVFCFHYSALFILSLITQEKIDGAQSAITISLLFKRLELIQNEVWGLLTINLIAAKKKLPQGWQAQTFPPRVLEREWLLYIIMP